MLGKTTLLAFAACAALCAQDWPVYHGGYENTKYSALKQIHTGNVAKLKLAWKYDTGEARKDSEMQCNPLVAGGRMLVSSPLLRVMALDPATGKELWKFDPHNGKPGSGKYRHRGFNYWKDGETERLFFAAGPYLYSLDAKTGQVVRSFGEGGRVDLRKGLDRDASTVSVGVSTPGVIYKDLLILGSIVSEGLPAAPGHIRAFDVRTGERKWIFHTLPQPGEFGYETWPKEAYQYLGGVNNWSGMALDAQRGVVFVPTGSAADDFYGANRHGDNLFANCLLALDAATGQRKWHFQFVRHDVWDRDLPSAPTLITVQHAGRRVDAVAQITKSGHVWVFDRDTGKSLFPFEEVAVPASEVPGEKLAGKQVLPLKPAPFARQVFTEEMVTNRTPEAHADVLNRLREVKSGAQFSPPSFQGTIIFPGFDGGGEWGGGAWDPETGLFYVNANEMAWLMRMVERKQKGRQSGKTAYVRYCAACHREDMRGAPPEFPALTSLSGRRAEEQVRGVVTKGSGRMPGFGHLPPPVLDAVLAYVMKGEDKELTSETTASPFEQKYRLDGYVRFLDPEGYPAMVPPWGTLNAINLNTGEYAWRQPFGEFPALVEKGLRNTGSENYGGGVVTAGGLLFIGATNSDHKMHAFDKRTGKLLWEYTMDAAGNSTPATYVVNGKQYVVIGAGGGKWGNVSGGSYYAFALPD